MVRRSSSALLIRAQRASHKRIGAFDQKRVHHVFLRAERAFVRQRQHEQLSVELRSQKACLRLTPQASFLALSCLHVCLRPVDASAFEAVRLKPDCALAIARATVQAIA